MVLITKNRTLLKLVRSAYQQAQVTADQVLVVWNSRIYLHESLIVMESVCPIYLDRIVEQLRIFTGDRPQPPGRFIWVRPVGNPARRWMPAGERRRPAPAVQAALAGDP
jgi:hypothetical protein